MPLTRRLTLSVATAAATLVALPTYAAINDPGTSARPAATPTRVTPSGGAPTGSAAPGATSNNTRSAPGSEGPTDPTRPAPSTFKAPEARGAQAPPDAPTIEPSSRFEVTPAAAEDRTGSTWPDAKDVFSEPELAQVIPGLTGVEARECRPSELDKGKETAGDTRCELALTIKGEPSAVRSRLVVNIRGFGAPEDVGRAWSTGLAAQQEVSPATPDRFTFYRRGALGASGAYTDGTTTRVLVQRPGVAGEIWFSGVGFTQLKSDYLASRKDFRNRITPALVRLIATKMAPA